MRELRVRSKFDPNPNSIRNRSNIDWEAKQFFCKKKKNNNSQSKEEERKKKQIIGINFFSLSFSLDVIAYFFFFEFHFLLISLHSTRKTFEEAKNLIVWGMK